MGNLVATSELHKYVKICEKNLITCSHCGIQYVGQTKNKILTRFNSQHYDISHNGDNKVARHFNKCPRHAPAKFEGLSISILSFIRAPPDTKAGQVEKNSYDYSLVPEALLQE